MITCDYLSFMTIIGYLYNYFLHLVVLTIILQLPLWLIFFSSSIWITFNMVFIESTHLCPISCKCDQMGCNLMCIQNIFFIFQNVCIHINILIKYIILINICTDIRMYMCMWGVMHNGYIYFLGIIIIFESKKKHSDYI